MEDKGDPLQGFWLRYLGFVWLTTVATGAATLVCYLVWNVAGIAQINAEQIYLVDRLGGLAILLVGLIFASFFLAPFFIAIACPVWVLLYRSASGTGTWTAARLRRSGGLAALLCSLAIYLLLGDRVFALFVTRTDTGGVLNHLLPYLPAALSLIIAPLIASRLYDHD
ncbi:hypothetical protein [Litorivita sp. NS0012-18]|uniref:hypothetical protein n=1 Tax=Litorivita sp. NS0012-18 TaxID=3127655 RepID=UPI003108024A